MEKDNDGATPLHFAAARGIRTYITSYIYNVRFVATLKYAISMYGTSMVVVLQATLQYWSGSLGMELRLKKMISVGLPFMMLLNMGRSRYMKYYS